MYYFSFNSNFYNILVTVFVLNIVLNNPRVHARDICKFYVFLLFRFP